MRRETLRAFLLCTLVGFWCVTARAQTVVTATTLNASAQSVCLGQAVTLTVTVTSDPAGSGIPTGSVDLLDGGNYVATTSLDAQGQGTFSVDWFDPGSHPLSAQYSGDANFNGSVSSASALLTVNPLPACSISGADAVCASSLNQIYSAPPGLAAYRWSVTGSATIAAATNSSTVVINAGAAGTFTLNLSLTNASGCASTCSKTVTMTPLPTATVSGGGTICPGASANLQAALTGVSPWTLTWSDGFTQTVSSSPAVRSVSPVSTTTYAVSSVSGGDCTGSSSGTAAVTVNTPATVSADPVSKAVCTGNPVSFTSTATGSPTPSIQWQVSTDAGLTFVNIPGATSTTYTFGTTSSDSGKQYRAQFSNTCAVAASAPALLTVNPLPACSISGADAVCASALNQVYSAPAGLAAYRWSVTGSATIAGVTNSSTVAINAGAAGTFTLNLSLTNASGCASTCSKTVSLTPLPTATVSGGGTICPGASANVQAALSGVSPWTLTWSDGFTQTVSSSPAVRSVSPVSTTTYTVSSVSGANCTGSSSGTAAVTVNTPATVTADPVSTAVCNGSAVSFTSAATGSPAPKIQWQVSTDAGVTFVNIPGATNTTYSFSAAPTDDGKKFRAQFTNTCALVASAPALLSINPLPNCSIAGAGALCANLANQAYAAPAGLAAYRWSISGSAAISGAANASLVTINVGASGSFTLTLTLTNSTGCASTCSKTVSILALPTAVVSGGGGICPGNSATLQAALTGVSPWTLTWSDGFTQTVANSPATRSASPTSNSTYTVTSVADANCANAGSGSASITINSSPVVTASPGNKSVCAGSPVSFSAAATGSPTPSAQWQVSTDAGTTFTNLAGATGSTYTFTTSLSDSAKRFRVLFTNACGTAVSSAATLTVNALPAATMTIDPIVCGGSSSNVVSVAPAGAGAGYAWTISGGTITSGAGTPTITYTAGASGSINISVTVTNAQGCSASASQSVALATTGKDLEAWRNKAPLQWQSSTFNDGDHQYSEGNSIPMRLELTQMCPGVPWSIVLAYDFKDGNTSRHFYDFLCTYDASELTVNGHELDSFRSAYPPTTFPIPVDSTLGYQLPGDFTVYNGMITNVSTYSVINGSTVDKQLVISGITTSGGGAKDVLILFGGHLARENEWGPGNGASSFPGASAKVLYQYYGASAFANFAVNPAGIVKQADLSISKTAAPNPLCAGNTLTYSLVIANSGPNQATPVTVLDTLPAGMTVNSVSLSQGTWSGTGTLNLALGAINAGSNATATIVVTVNRAAAGGTVTNTATVSAGAPADPYSLNNTASAVTLIFPHPSASPLTDQAVCRGAPATFSTIAIGAPPITYQWTRNGSLLPGATNSIYTIPAVSDADVGTYCVMVAAQCNSISDVITNCASLTISPATSTSALSDQVKCPGESASFSTTAAGTGPFALAWKKDGVLIPGATNSTLLLTNVSATDAGAYCVEVAGACNATSACARLVVLTNTAATPLLSQTNCLGDTVTFTTVASGSGPFAYLWRKDGTLLSGQTASSLTLPSISSAQAGNYCVEVTGHCNSVTNCASLLLWTSTTADPLVSQTNCPGATVVFSTTAHGDGPFTYQWAKDGLPLGGQTANSLTLTNASAASGGTYSVWVNGLCNGVTNSARLVINQNAYVATPPVNLTNCLGTSAGFTVAAGGTGPFTYQWYKGATALAGQTNNTLTLPAVTATDAGTYQVVLAGNCGNAVTNSASLFVNPSVTADPLISRTTCPGTSASFSTTAHGTAPFAYQWLKNGAPLPGQTAPSLTLSNLTGGDTATYSVRVTDACGSLTQAASLFVNTPVTADPLVSQTLCPGAALSLSTLAHGTGPFTYQWIKDGKPLPNATNNFWSIASATVLDDGAYMVIVTGPCNALTNNGTVTVHPPTTLTPLADLTLCFGATATFSTTPSGTGPFTFTWKKNGIVLAGQTTNTLTLPRVQASDAGTYSVEASGLCNSASSSATLAIESQGLVSPATFANPAPITINDFSAGSPYPSTIDISCVSGPLSQLSVTLTNLSHTYASDIDILLVGPSGQAIMLMSDTGGANGLTNATLTFSDSALNSLPQNGPIPSGVYKPTDYPPEDNMPVPAPLPPYATNLAAFSGTDANGTWSLYVVDDALMDTGMIAGGWSLTLRWTSALAVQSLAPVLVSQAPAGMTLQGQSGQCYVIEASTDLVTWTPILTNTLITTSCYLVDVDRTNFTHRFYRAVARP